MGERFELVACCIVDMAAMGAPNDQRGGFQKLEAAFVRACACRTGVRVGPVHVVRNVAQVAQGA